MNTAAPQAAPNPSSGGFWSWLRQLRLTVLAVLGIVILTAVVVLAVAAPAIAPFDPGKVSVLDRLKPPLSEASGDKTYWLGTDGLGRDVWSRIVYGSRISLLVGLGTVAIGGLLGVTLGLITGYWGGVLDDVIMRLGDIQLALPSMLLYLAILAIIGGGLVNIIVILGVTDWVNYARVVRGQVLSLRSSEYVMAAQGLGAKAFRIMRRHILPNVLAPVLVIASFAVARNVIVEASLSFLGVGVPLSIPTWGSMLAEGRDSLRLAWWPVTFPGIALVLLVLAVNVLGDWLRDYFDPQLEN